MNSSIASLPKALSFCVGPLLASGEPSLMESGIHICKLKLLLFYLRVGLLASWGQLRMSLVRGESSLMV
jgi:hypothetical protein